MAQKIIVFEGEYNKDILTDDRVAGLIAKGYSVKSVSAVTVPDRKPTCYLLLENAAGGGETVDASDVSVTGSWLSDYRWTQATDNKPLDSLMQIVCSIIDGLITSVDGKLATGNFYAVATHEGPSYTFELDAVVPNTSTIYYDVLSGKSYMYDSSQSAYVQISSSSNLADLVRPQVSGALGSETATSIADHISILYDMFDVIGTKVEGKLSSGSFYGVDERTASSITYKEVAEVGAANKIYVDVNDGNKLYRYDSGTSAYVRIGVR